MHNLDLKDRKILTLLEDNARESHSTIAKAIGLSKDSVKYRIQRLEKQGIIGGYRTIINLSKIGYELYSVCVKVINVKDMNAIAIEIAKEQKLFWIAELDGAWDLIFVLWAKNAHEADIIITRAQQQIGIVTEKLVTQIINFQFLPVYKDLNKKPHIIDLEQAGVRIDLIDKEILRTLNLDARATLLSLAQRLEVDPMTIYHRMKKMEKNGIIIGYTIIIDASKLGLDYYSVKINLVNQLQRNKILTFLQDRIIGITHVLGGYDLDFDMYTKSTQEYYELLKELRAKFDIQTIEHFKIVQTHRIKFLPEEL
ncbi:MAG: winged helix-turn-helix transcriptional regulator [Candidatus Woesearchaeota archaeon]